MGARGWNGMPVATGDHPMKGGKVDATVPVLVLGRTRRERSVEDNVVILVAMSTLQRTGCNGVYAFDNNDDLNICVLEESLHCAGRRRFITCNRGDVDSDMRAWI